MSKTQYPKAYAPELLEALPRSKSRHDYRYTDLPFKGVDMWTAYEVSWLNESGKPQVALAEIYVPCESSHLIESKSLKLYLNSLNMQGFATPSDVQKTIQRDIGQALAYEISVSLIPISTLLKQEATTFNGVLLDAQDVSCNTYQVEPNFLTASQIIVTETLVSNLLKSNCPVTGQPDWASIQIHYEGNQISHHGLLRYIVSYRDHAAFHEDCVEQIFCDIMEKCAPKKLSVYARYTRRGGIDINPFRSNFEDEVKNTRLLRQ